MTKPASDEKSSIWNIINMSDSYTLRAADYEIAAMAVTVLGNGQYFLEELQVANPRKVPAFMFHGEAGMQAWWKENFGHEYPEMTPELYTKLASVLDTVVIGSLDYRLTLEKRLEHGGISVEELQAEHDKMRSSMNDIGGRAKRLADTMRQRAKGERAPMERSPQQVF